MIFQSGEFFGEGGSIGGDLIKGDAKLTIFPSKVEFIAVEFYKVTLVGIAGFVFDSPVKRDLDIFSRFFFALLNCGEFLDHCVERF